MAGAVPLRLRNTIVWLVYHLSIQARARLEGREHSQEAPRSLLEVGQLLLAVSVPGTVGQQPGEARTGVRCSHTRRPSAGG